MKELGMLFNAEFGYATLRVTTPILFASLGILISDLAGVVNIAVEGGMLQAALWGVLVSARTGSAWIGLLAGVVSAMCIAALLGYFHLRLRSDLILTGIALNIFSSGSTVLFLYLFTGNKGISSGVKSLVLPRCDIPGIANIPILGEIVSGHNVLTYAAFVSVLVVHYLLYKTPYGLRLRAVGEHPQAAASVGIRVNRVKLGALLLSGFFAGLGGTFLSMGYVSWFGRGMTAGRGFIGLVAETLGGRSAFGALWGSLVFGFTEAFAATAQAFRIPAEFANAIPYIAAIVAFVAYASRGRHLTR